MEIAINTWKNLSWRQNSFHKVRVYGLTQSISFRFNWCLGSASSHFCSNRNGRGAKPLITVKSSTAFFMYHRQVVRGNTCHMISRLVIKRVIAVCWIIKDDECGRKLSLIGWKKRIEKVSLTSSMLTTMPVWWSQKSGQKEVGFSGKHLIRGIKRHIVIDANGHPLAFTMGRANWNDQRNLLVSIDGVRFGKRRRRPKRSGVDKGYDSELLRRELRRRRITRSLCINPEAKTLWFIELFNFGWRPSPGIRCWFPKPGNEI